MPSLGRWARFCALWVLLDFEGPHGLYFMKYNLMPPTCAAQAAEIGLEGRIMPKKIAVIDGNSLMHRAYHAVPATMNAPDGTPTNAAFGFLSMFLKFYEMARPDAWYARLMLDVRHSAWRRSNSTKPSARRWMLSSRHNSPLSSICSNR